MKALPIAFAGAFAIHAAAALSIAAFGVLRGDGPKPAAVGPTVDIETVVVPPTVPEREPLPTAPTAASRASDGEPREKPSQAAPQIATTATPTLATTTAPTNDSVPSPLPTQAPTTARVRFAMAMSSQPGTPNGTATGATRPTEAIVRDEDVAVRARQIGGALPTYPPEAVAQGVELDAPLAFEIVVDPTGRVTSTRELRHVGYGFDEAANAALRNYRFSPAMRDGHPVAVRMRWTVAFKLE